MNDISKQRRNEFESDLMLMTLNKTVLAVRRGQVRGLNHSSRCQQHMYLVALLANVLAIESFLSGTSTTFGLPLPNRMPDPRDKTRKVNASLEFKAKFLLDYAKANLKWFRFSKENRFLVIRRVNAAFKTVSTCIRVRHHLAHGKTYFALRRNRKDDRHWSRFMREIDFEDFKTITQHSTVYRQFCHTMINPDYRRDLTNTRVFVGMLLRETCILGAEGAAHSPDFSVVLR